MTDLIPRARRQLGVSIDRPDVSTLTNLDRVHASIYKDPEIFEMESERIFHKTWIFVAHTSEIPNPGDWKNTHIGRQPVIASRREDGGVSVMLNRCRHRGTTVCEGRLGHSKRFRCPYHAWVYDGSDGRLVGVPYKQGYDDGFCVEELGLIHVARVDEYCGLIFASLDHDVVDLPEYLGNVKPYIEEFFGQGAGRQLKVTPGINQNVYPGNWKFQLENSMDNYHVPVVHKIFMDNRHGTTSYPPNDTRRTRDLGGGHGALYRKAFSDEPTDDTPTGFNALIFPSLVIINVQLRVIYPLDVNHTKVELLPLIIDGASDEENAKRMRLHEDFFGPAGFGTPDDAEAVMRRTPLGMQADTGDDWVYFARGVTTDEPEEGGVLAGAVTYETAQRGFYKGWREYMVGEDLR